MGEKLARWSKHRHIEYKCDQFVFFLPRTLVLTACLVCMIISPLAFILSPQKDKGEGVVISSYREIVILRD